MENLRIHPFDMNFDEIAETRVNLSDCNYFVEGVSGLTAKMLEKAKRTLN